MMWEYNQMWEKNQKCENDEKRRYDHYPWYKKQAKPVGALPYRQRKLQSACVWHWLFRCQQALLSLRCCLSSLLKPLPETFHSERIYDRNGHGNAYQRVGHNHQ